MRDGCEEVCGVWGAEVGGVGEIGECEALSVSPMWVANVKEDRIPENDI